MPKHIFDRGFAYLGKGDFENAIKDCNKAIQHKPDYAEAYSARGITWLLKQEWEKAKSDLITARDMGVDIVDVFPDSFGIVENFEQITGVQLPEDIAALLTPPQA